MWQKRRRRCFELFIISSFLYLKMCSACFKENKQAVIRINNNISPGMQNQPKCTFLLFLRSLNRRGKLALKHDKYLKTQTNRQLCNSNVRREQKRKEQHKSKWAGWLGDWGNTAYNRLLLTKPLIMQPTVRCLAKVPILCCLCATWITDPLRGHHSATVKKRFYGGKGTSENVWAKNFCFIAQWDVLFIKVWLLHHGDLWCHWLGY